MIKFIRYIPKVIHLLYIVSKYRVLTDSGHFELPFSLKVLGRFFSIILYPIGLFTKSNLNFGQRLAGLFQSLGDSAGIYWVDSPDKIVEKCMRVKQQDVKEKFNASELGRKFVTEFFTAEKTLNEIVSTLEFAIQLSK